MNGRCEKDALDRADDICELCGNQYCAMCLLFPRGHRNPPTCKTCALQNSGLRGGSTKRGTISKREYKKLKQELLEQLEGAEHQAPAIEFFEMQDPSQFDRSNELDRRPATLEVEPTIDILTPNNEAAAATPAPPGPVEQTPPPGPPAFTPPPPTNPSQPMAAPAPPAAPAHGFAPVDTSVNPLALGGTPATHQTGGQATQSPSEASESAAELLARLKADQPIHSQFGTAPTGLDTDPFAASTSELLAPPPPHTAPTYAAPPAHTAPAPTYAAPAAPAPQPERPTNQTWSPPAPPPRGSNLAGTPTPHETAPTGQAFGQPASAPSPSPFDTAPAPNPAPGGLSPNGFGNTEHEAQAPNPGRRKADLDETGQWVPPSLRGMEAEDDRAPLPKRH